MDRKKNKNSNIHLRAPFLWFKCELWNHSFTCLFLTRVCLGSAKEVDLWSLGADDDVPLHRMRRVFWFPSVISRLKRRLDLILCWHLQGARTGIDWNELNSLSELERGLELEQMERKFGPVHQRKRERFALPLSKRKKKKDDNENVNRGRCGIKRPKMSESM